MRTQTTLLLSLLFTLIFTSSYSQGKDTSSAVFVARSMNATAPNLVYRIQIGTVTIKTKARYLLKRYHIKDEPFLEAENANTIKVMIGSYPTYSLAKKRLDELKGNGMKTAFIAPYYKGQRVSLQEAATHTQQ